MSPVCRAVSIAFARHWGRMDEQERAEVERKGVAFLHVCCEVAMHQISLGWDVVLEHPHSASSWDLERVWRQSRPRPESCPPSWMSASMA
eukprot:6842736-Pyramimonas_sp.AAC.1